MQVLEQRYCLERAVGRGGMATVWQARDLLLHRTVAVKLMAPELAADAGLRGAVLDEARSAARLSHPHLSGVYDYGEIVDGDRRQPFVVMEYIDGTTLAARIAASGPMAWTEALPVCAQVADALITVHDAGLVHRDVKPGNIMLTAAGIKLVDFGVATSAGRPATDTFGRIWGTPGYLPPEQLRQEPASPAGDVYALGLLLYTCLAGAAPWSGTTLDALLTERRRKPVPKLPEPAGLPADVERLYRRCLRSDPADRPSAAQAARLLWQVSSRSDPLRTAVQLVPRETTTPLPALPGRRRRYSRRALLMAVAPAAVLAGALGARLVLSPGDDVAQAGIASGSRVEDATSCAVDYSSDRRPDGSFTAQVQMSNTGLKGLPTWSMRFTLPDGHRVSDVFGATWAQHNDRLTVSANGGLPPGTAATLSVTGTFDRQADDLPTDFSVNDAPCARTVTRVLSSSMPPGIAGDAQHAARTWSTLTGKSRAPAPSAAAPTTTTPPTSAPPTSTAPPTMQPTSSPPQEPTQTPSAKPTPTTTPSPTITPSDDPGPSPSEGTSPSTEPDQGSSPSPPSSGAPLPDGPAPGETVDATSSGAQGR